MNEVLRLDVLSTVVIYALSTGHQPLIWSLHDFALTSPIKLFWSACCLYPIQAEWFNYMVIS